MRGVMTGLVAGWALAFAAPAFADAAPASREVQSAVDAYLASARADSSLVGGAGQAGYDGGFWIRGGSFLMKINLTLQTRWEGYDWDDTAFESSPGGDLSGFSLPRATLKFSGQATCDVRYYAELEFGHAGMAEMGMMMEPIEETHPEWGTLREGWIDYSFSDAFAVRMGLVKLATTRQLMTPPEMQQFVDVSMASAAIGMMMPGYTDRNRDYGVMFHGSFGCDGAWSWLATITNGDGAFHRNVLDGETNDNFAYSARVNWDVIGRIGYEECALNHRECEWRLAVGAWGFGYANVVQDQDHVTRGNEWYVGADVAGGYGGFSFCAAYTYGEMKDGDPGYVDETSGCWCVQAGYLFPGTAWEVAARYSLITMDMGTGPGKMTEGAHEIGVAVNYFIDGHSDKVTLDVAFISPDDDGEYMFSDTYAGYNILGESDAVLVRLQWQLAL
ncbi:MAG: hypothetical protein JNM10_00360 [Planctomycetia bacterium]|nr:hypothetical protein [Planctomycetia bacterium]